MNTCKQQLLTGASVSGPYQRWDLSNCGAGRLHVAINCGILSVRATIQILSLFYQNGAVCSASLHAIQEVLDDPIIKL